jgi:hypothetical protein
MIYAIITVVYKDGTSSTHRVKGHSEMLMTVDQVYVVARENLPVSLNIVMVRP